MDGYKDCFHSFENRKNPFDEIELGIWRGKKMEWLILNVNEKIDTLISKKHL